MTIVIFTSKIENDFDTGLPAFRAAHIWITDGTTNYVCDRGNLSLTGNLQTILNAQESTIWADMLAGGVLATAAENEIAGGIQTYIANNGMKTAVFDKTMAQEDTDITAMLQILFPSNTAPFVAAKLGMKQLLIASLIAVRVDAHERGLV